MTSKLVVTHLSHDLQARKSYVSFAWSDDPAKRLGLEVPYGTALADVEAAARQALTDLSSELTGSELSLP
ncbi:MAG: hypothetical protein P0Y65_18565 [Candidatus Devosia phytovorans]|uniref:Uncharacterized protein n=1 Tax=Candidatus Devosia phytovorans TaxID=3121372 RepID=A0AAJ5VVH4_9HYPH|nr:hypothetical protein [Devosia sp.]WEK04159.1 MAG: hypothetical protein P0Y65_18565 [Devosia sp.]